MHRQGLYQSNVQWSWPFFNFLGSLPNFFPNPFFIPLYFYLFKLCNSSISQAISFWSLSPFLFLFHVVCHPFGTIFVKMWEGLRPSLEKFCLKSIFGKDNDIYDGGWRMTQRKIIILFESVICSWFDSSCRQRRGRIGFFANLQIAK